MVGKRYSISLAVLAFLGVVVTGILVYLHYHPGLTQSFPICGGKFGGNCNVLDQWKHAVIFHVPLASYGFFMYLTIFFTILVTGYASGAYRAYGLVLVFPVIILALLADIALAGVMFKLKTYCILCIITYIINILLLLTAYLGRRQLIAQGGPTFRETLTALIPGKADLPEKKAAIVLYVLFITSLFVSMFLISFLLETRLAETKQRNKFSVEAFYNAPPVNLALPDSTLMIGPRNAKVNIVVFTDFLCSACITLDKNASDIAKKYGNKVSFSFYNYPHDPSCNSNTQTGYAGACIASKAALSAASQAVLPEYMEKHVSRYTEIHTQYSREIAVDIASGLTDTSRFMQELDSDAVAQIIQRDIALAEELGIKGTPTLFINGRRLEGALPYEILDTIIQRELSSTVVQ